MYFDESKFAEANDYFFALNMYCAQTRLLFGTQIMRNSAQNCTQMKANFCAFARKLRASNLRLETLVGANRGKMRVKRFYARFQLFYVASKEDFTLNFKRVTLFGPLEVRLVTTLHIMSAVQVLMV